MIDHDLVMTITDDIVAFCKSSPESRIKSDQMDRIFAAYNLLPRKPTPLHHRSRGAYTGTRRAIHNRVRTEMKRRGLLLDRIKYPNKHEVAIYQMTDGATASIQRLMDDPAMIPKRTKRLAQEMRRFINRNDLTPTDLPKDKQKLLMKMLDAEAEDAAKGLRRRFRFALEITGVPLQEEALDAPA